MSQLKAFTFNKNPKKRTVTVTNLSPSFFKLDKEDKKRFGTLHDKLHSLAEDLADGSLHHYELIK